MALVSFEQIEPRRPIDPQAPDVAPDVYTLPWGYFTFVQSLELNYTESSVYSSNGIFVIDGAFTIDAEDKLDPGFIDSATGHIANEAAALTRLESRFSTLEDMFNSAAHATEPADKATWFTATDPRCITLPEPLVDASGQPIRALPVSLTLGESQMSAIVRYSAVLREGVVPTNILLVNDIPLHDARVAISPPAPIAARARALGGEGSTVQITNYSRTEVVVTGLLPLHGDGVHFETSHKDFLGALSSGRMSLKRTRWANGELVTDTMLSGVRVSASQVDSRPTDQGVYMTVKGTL